MDRNDVAAMLGKSRACKSIDRAMSIVSQGWDLVAVRDGGTAGDWERAEREHSGAHLAVVARGRTPATDRIGVFRPVGYAEQMFF